MRRSTKENAKRGSLLVKKFLDLSTLTFIFMGIIMLFGSITSYDINLMGMKEFILKMIGVCVSFGFGYITTMVKSLFR